MHKKAWFQRLLRWIGMVFGVFFLFALGYFGAQSGWLDPLVGGGAARDGAVAPSAQMGAVVAQDSNLSTVPIRSAASAVGIVSAAGNLELAAEQQVVVEVSGIVAKLSVKVGDYVEAGDLLVMLDSTEAER